MRCAPGYVPTLYASGLRSPDGLAFAPSGLLHVAEEGANRVSRIEADGTVTPILKGVRSPEGIAFDGAGNLYVVEDRRSGRLLRRTPEGQVEALASGLHGPEGVAVGPTLGGEPASTVYVTESSAQFARSPTQLETGVTAISSRGESTRVIAHTPALSRGRIDFWSYAGITVGPDGWLYVANELSRQPYASSGEKARRVVLIPGVLALTAPRFADDSVLRIDPLTGSRELVASGLLAPEGLAFAAEGDYPLYVAEENVGFKSRLSRIERDGRRTTVCGSLRGLEDVAVDAHGDLYVSEDKTGYVIRIRQTGETDVPRAQEDPRVHPDLLARDDPLASPTEAGTLHQLWARVAALARWIARLVQRSNST